MPRNASAWRLRAIVVDRRVSQRFWLKSARARRFFRSQRPRYFGIVPGTTAKACPPFITLFLDNSGSKSARAGRGSAIAAAGAIPLLPSVEVVRELTGISSSLCATGQLSARLAASFLNSMARACIALLLLGAASALRQPQTVTLRDVKAVHKSNCRGASPPLLNHSLHAIDATPTRWRGRL